MLLAPIVLLSVLQAAPTPAYDPLKVDAVEQTMVDLTIHVASRNRDIPVRVYLPAQKTPQPVVLYSHGLGGSRETSAFLGKHWAQRGYVAVFMQHPGSDESVWSDKAPSERMAALGHAANLEQFLARVQDVPDVIDAITRWNAEKGHALMGRMDLTKIGMSGHSFGAITTEAVSGETTSTGRSFTDPRIRAAVIFSPSPPKRGDAATAFASVKIPWMLMTGTKDVAPIGNDTAESRLKVFPALPAGHKYELVLDGAQHSVFTDRQLPGDEPQRNPKHHPAIEALSTAFWDAYLRGDAAAQKWLDGTGPRSILEAADKWETK
ncbi:MAG: dienelactone hydrolase [Deltaproteobacteria bacterium]|nr:dienelactone hydrolase [Deltaproteobacteria bacterium]